MFKAAALLLRQHLDSANLAKASKNVATLHASLERAAAYATPSAGNILPFSRSKVSGWACAEV